MLVTADTILRGSAELDRMKNEIVQVTNTLFWLAKNDPKLWVRYNRDGKGWDIWTQFGCLETGRVAWEVYFSLGGVRYREGLRARCVYRQGEEDKLMLAFTTANNDEEPCVWALLGTEGEMGIAGIQIAREGLDLFVQGMMKEFPLPTAIEPYLRAAQRTL